jgi:NADPH-dependent 2,4-dienoyl-CoA reductase/sulfur reductase-like enzyme/ferredoxin
MPERVHPRVWTALRWFGVACALGIVAASIIDPPLGLLIFWGVFVPIVPLVFLVAPAMWRNVCPMASLNQIPRTLGFTRGLTLPLWVQQYAPLVSAGLFLAIVAFRKVLLESSGIALAVFLLSVLALAFLGGVFFKGKSGWCSQFCPMLQVERFYGQSPLLVVRNSHCRPCVGCTKNCYDFNPTAAYLADLYDDNPRLTANRKVFAGAMPWLIFAFFTQPELAGITVGNVVLLYGRILLFVAAGIGVFMALDAISNLGSYRLVLGHVVVALNLFYWFVAPRAMQQFGLEETLLPYLLQAAVAVLTVVWLLRALPRERLFRGASHATPARDTNRVLRVYDEDRAQKVEVAFSPGPTVLAKDGQTLLEVAEDNQVNVEAGCRMGMCGADPVRITAGMENLSPVSSAERATLERLGLTAECRMACSAHVQGPVTVVPTADPAAVQEEPAVSPTEANGTPAAPGFAISEVVRRVVVIGAGAAGVNAAIEVRKLHPEGEITLIGDEPYDFYNRMAIGKLVSEATAIDKLYLMPRDWAAARRIRFLRGVSATAIDRTKCEVRTDEGESLPYDRLLLATGAQSFVPEIEGFGLEGTFVLRTIEDAVQVQQYIRRQSCRRALIIGGGLLGLEAAHSITELGAYAFVLNRNEWPLNRQLDRPAGMLLDQMMQDFGIAILPWAEPRRIFGTERVEGVVLSDGRKLGVDLCLVATGIRPNVGLALAAGLAVRRGVVVDDRMMTSDSHVFAAGDVTEHKGRVQGLWPASMEQAHVAATNLLGGDLRYAGGVPPAKLKVPEIDLLSVGETEARSEGARELRFEDRNPRRYRKLVLRHGKVCGAILLGHTELTEPVARAVEANMDVIPVLAPLERGDWSVLSARSG